MSKTVAGLGLIIWRLAVSHYGPYWCLSCVATMPLSLWGISTLLIWSWHWVTSSVSFSTFSFKVLGLSSADGYLTRSSPWQDKMSATAVIATAACLTWVQHQATLTSLRARRHASDRILHFLSAACCSSEPVTIAAFTCFDVGSTKSSSKILTSVKESEVNPPTGTHFAVIPLACFFFQPNGFDTNKIDVVTAMLVSIAVAMLWGFCAHLKRV